MPERSTPSPTLAIRWRRTEPLRRRIALGAAVGSVGALVMAFADTAWVRTGLNEPPPLGDVFLLTLGLIGPLALLFGALVGVLSWFVHPRAEPSIGGLLTRLREAGAGRPADVAAVAPLAALALFAWATLAAHLARLVLAAEMSSLTCGAILALGSIALAALLGVLVFALTPTLRHRLAAWSGAVPRLVDPAATLGAALLLVAALVTVGAWRGTVSGEGGFLGIYGILKRDALDLRLPVLFALLGLAVYLSPLLLRSVKPYQALIIGLLPLALTVRAAIALNEQAVLSLLIERTAPISSRPLKLLRKLTDRDGDGASGLFGGGDCNDANTTIGPALDDVPDNGIDEDCSGSDLSLAGVLADAQPKVLPPAEVEKLKQRVPKNGNVILITVDTLRHDLGYMGYARNISPNIDVLAKRSVVFERAYSLASYTGKSVGPTMIGKYPSETDRRWGHFDSYKKETFLAERLQRAKIHTMSVHGHRYFSRWGECGKTPEGCGLERGFDEIDLRAAPPDGVKWAKDATVTSDKLTDAAIDLLDKRPAEERFFLWVHYLDPHEDYLPHDDVPSFGSDARDLYDAEVAFTDKHIGRLLDHVAKAGWGERTSIIVTSDHGEAFGEHKQWRHGVELWEPLVRVPLIVAVPGAAPARVSARRSLIDLAPTVLELMDVPLPAADAPDFLSGVSLLPDLFPAAGEQPQVRDILIDMPAGPYNDARRAFIHGDLKLISRGTGKEVYDLAQDPEERTNVWAERSKDIEAYYAVAKKRLREIEVSGERK